MHVLYLIDSLAAGGAETSLASMAPELSIRGVCMDVAYLQERSGVAQQLRSAGATLYSLAHHHGRPSWIWSVRRLMTELRPDLVHTTLFEADVAGRLAAATTAIPVVSTLANLAYGPEQLTNPHLRRGRVKAAQVVDALTARRVTRFHAISETVAEVMGRRLALDAERIDVVPRGRDPGLLGRRTPARRQAARRQLGVAPETTLVLAAARHEHQKGLDLLIRAWPAVRAAMPRTRLVVAGREGNQSELLRSLARDLGLDDDVRFLGGRSDVGELLCAADAFVLPSRWEGLGSVLVEAMALEAPVVASDLPSVREVMGADGARLVVPDDPGALATGLVDALADPTDAERRARGAYHCFLERFTVAQAAEGMVRCYRRALEEGPRLARRRGSW